MRTFKSNSTCEACGANCTSCTSASECTLCNKNLFLDSGNCTASCPAGKFASNSTCKACNPRCATCERAGKCLSCKPGATGALYNGNCVAKCPANPRVITVSDSLCLDCPAEAKDIDKRAIKKSLDQCNLTLSSSEQVNGVARSIGEVYSSVKLSKNATSNSTTAGEDLLNEV